MTDAPTPVTLVIQSTMPLDAMKAYLTSGLSDPVVSQACDLYAAIACRCTVPAARLGVT